MTANRTRQQTSDVGLVASTLAYVRTEDGVVEVQRGGKIPAGAVPDFAARLRDKGVFVTQAELDKADADAAKQAAAEAEQS